MNLEERDHSANLAVGIGLAANALLAGLKTTIGIVAHSPALLADGINSTSDVAYYIIVAVFMRLARKPADTEHPFGHTQLESIAALVVGAFVMTTAIAIFWDAINSVFDLWARQVGFGGAAISALWVALFTVALKVGLTFITRRIGSQTGNAAVLALAYDHRNDVFSASAATIGIMLGRMGYPWVDPLAGALVALVILRTGIGIIAESSTELMDTVPSEALAAKINKLLRKVGGVDQVEKIEAHRFGPFLTVNLTIGVNGTLSVAQGDAIASAVERTLTQNIELLARVHVHYHPVRHPVAGMPRSQAVPLSTPR